MRQVNKRPRRRGDRVTPKHLPGPPMTLDNMRERGVYVIDVSSYSGDLKVLSSQRRIKCGRRV